MEHRIIKRGREWVDCVSDEAYTEFTDLPYDECQEGLCQKYGRTVLKNIGYPKIVLIGKKPPKDLSSIKPISVYFVDRNKVRKEWIFTPAEIDIIQKEFKKKKSLEQITSMILCPPEALENVVDKLGGGRRGGIKRSPQERRRGSGRSRITRVRKDAS